MKHLIISVLALLTLQIAPAFAEMLSARDINTNIIGKRIYLATPFGGEFPLNYLPSGEVTGDGEVLGLGRFLQPQDRGRWWVDADRLCQQFETWYDGKPMCFELSWIGPDQVSWVRDNGEKGTARIGQN